MNVIQPARSTFWRIVLLVTANLPFLASWQLLGLARELDVVIRASRSWLAFLSVMVVGGAFGMLALVFTYTRLKEQVFAFLEAPAQIRWPAILFLPVSLVAYTFFFALPISRNLLGNLGWVRFLVFCFFALVGMYSLKALKKELDWLSSLLLVVLFQGLVHLLISQVSSITAYPFSMGWSETSRFYYPALFLSEEIFGARMQWPILHPSLHLLLVPPYMVDAPLWIHRFWQVFLRISMLGLTSLVLIRRLSGKNKILRGLLWMWMVLYLFQGPVYFHLAIPLILVMWGFSANDDRRTWLVVIIASIWSGISRINWYPVPGLLAAVLFILEVPYQGRQLQRYLRKPAMWILAGLGIAFVAQRAYIALSGIPSAEFFYTSLTSNLLWYRLFPNASYRYGVLASALIASLPGWAAILFVIRRKRADIHPMRLGLIFSALLVLFAGGLVVSMKIGGGVDIHNLDAYLGLLLILTVYLIFVRYTPESGASTDPVSLHWSLLALLVVVPVWFNVQGGVLIKTYDAMRTKSVLDQIQVKVDDTNARGGEILFITQRHLVSMHVLREVQIISEYEREELMEMAMGNNRDYLRKFRADMDNQRFELILVDPLKFRLLGNNYAFGEENNAWAQRVMKPILCNYQEDEIFPDDQIAIYVPQSGARQCP